MLARIGDRNLPVVFGSTLLLGTAYGVSVALTALHLDGLGFSKGAIGAMASCFAAGVVLASLPVGWLVRRTSARAVLVAALVGYGLCLALFPHLRGPVPVGAARVLDGAFSVGVWVSCETILLARANPDHRALATSLYAATMALGYVLGPMVAFGVTAVASTTTAFTVASALAGAAAVVARTRLDRDAASALGHHGDDGAPATPAMQLARQIRASLFATFAYGYFQAGVALFLPLYLVGAKHIPRSRTMLVPAFFAAGMLLLSHVAGRVGDRVGHLRVMRALAVVGAATTASFIFLDHFAAMAAAVFVAGAALASISPVSLALQGAIVDARDYARANALYNAVYAAGMLVGPVATGRLFEAWGGAVMLAHLAALWVAFAAFALVCAADDPAAARDAAAAGTRLPPTRERPTT